MGKSYCYGHIICGHIGVFVLKSILWELSVVVIVMNNWYFNENIHVQCTFCYRIHNGGKLIFGEL